jgi:hypothetical protein
MVKLSLEGTEAHRQLLVAGIHRSRMVMVSSLCPPNSIIHASMLTAPAPQVPPTSMARDRLRNPEPPTDVVVCTDLLELVIAMDVVGVVCAVAEVVRILSLALITTRSISTATTSLRFKLRTRSQACPVPLLFSSPSNPALTLVMRPTTGIVIRLRDPNRSAERMDSLGMGPTLPSLPPLHPCSLSWVECTSIPACHR